MLCAACDKYRMKGRKPPEPQVPQKAQIDKAKGRFHHEGSKDTKKSINHQALFKAKCRFHHEGSKNSMKTINHQALFKAKGRFHHEGPKDSKKTIIHQALIKPEAENISHGDHGADTEEHGELKMTLPVASGGVSIGMVEIYSYRPQGRGILPMRSRIASLSGLVRLYNFISLCF